MIITDVGSVSSLWRYPISSLGGQKSMSMRITTAGAEGDRTHALVDLSSGAAINPAQAQWQAAPQILSRLTGGALEVSFDGAVWSSPDQPDTRERLGRVFGKAIGLRRYAEQADETHATHRYRLSPIHLVSVQALATMRRLLPDAHVDERRFRPNMVVDLPHTLDALPEYSLIGREFRVGGLRLRGIQKTGRCSFTTLQQLGMTADRAILQTLVTQFERDFGIYCEVLSDGEISLGDRLTVEVPEVPSKVVIVGGGQAGGAAARALRDHGFDGQITILGDEGLPPYERPPLSKSFVLERPVATGLTSVLTAADAGRLGITLSLDDAAVSVDRLSRRIETRRGQRLAYDRLIFATGGVAKTIPGLCQGYGRVHLLRTAQNAEALRQRLAQARSIFVLGSGWLGLEVASSAREHGLQVTLFGRQDHVCARALPHRVADVVANWHVAAGVDLRLGSEPRFVEYADRVEAVQDDRVDTADLLVVAIGISANDALARQAGLPCNDGVFTDANGATSDPCVFAIGDVSRQRLEERTHRIESWQNANDQANRAARAILGLENPATGLARFWSEQFGHTLHIAGLPRADAPLLVADDAANYWEFEGFAVGIDQPMRVHRYAMAHVSGDGAPQDTDPDDWAHLGAKRYPLELATPLADGELRKVQTGLGDLVVVRVGHRIYAVDERCPHSAASLAEGMLSGHRIVCPLHFAEFDLRDGSPHQAPKGCPKLRTFRVTEEENEFWLWIPETASSGEGR